jgi:hypothetical protein
MKKLNRMHTFTLSVVMTGLSMMPVWAFSGEIDAGLLETVTCINYDTGQAVSGTAGVGGFDCSALTRGLEDRIGVVLVGTSEEGPGECNPVQEVESNNDINQGQFQDLGTLEAGGCVAVKASTSVGFGDDPNNPDPNADVDWYVIDTSRTAQPMFSLRDFDGTALYGVFDFATGDRLEVQPRGEDYAILGQPDRVAFRVRTQQPDTYTLQFSDGAASGGLSSLNSTMNQGHIIHESR